MSTEFKEALAQKIGWLLDNGDPDGLPIAEYLIESGAVADPAEIERLTAQAGKATVETVNRLLGVNLWDAPSFRAGVRIDFDEFGAVLSATLTNPKQADR